jgi:NADPH-dependent ferric siderophore reductase
MDAAVQKRPGFFTGVKAFLDHKGRRVWSLTVFEKMELTPRLTRVRFRGADLDELEWRRGQDLVLELPVPGGNARRHYTIAGHSAEARTLDIDFVLHGKSPANDWVRTAKGGDRIDAAGPRGRTTLNMQADWHLFTGDETCVPGILAMLEGLPAHARSFAFIEVESDADKFAFSPPAGTELTWIVRGGAPRGAETPLLAALEAFALPAGRGHAYTIGETSMVRALRHHLIARGFTKDQISAEGYWRPGRIGGHDHV